jgi:hypothetical protein
MSVTRTPPSGCGIVMDECRGLSRYLVPTGNLIADSLVDARDRPAPSRKVLVVRERIQTV